VSRAINIQHFDKVNFIYFWLCNKSIPEICSLLNIPWSTVSGIITKRKQLGITATQPWSGMLRHTVCKSRQLLVKTLCGLQISSWTVCRELHGMGFHGQTVASKPYITKCNAKSQMLWCKARHWTREVGTCSLEWRITLLCLTIRWTSLGLAGLHCAKC